MIETQIPKCQINTMCIEKDESNAYLQYPLSSQSNIWTNRAI